MTFNKCKDIGIGQNIQFKASGNLEIGRVVRIYPCKTMFDVEYVGGMFNVYFRDIVSIH